MNGNNPYKNRRGRPSRPNPRPRRVQKSARQKIRDLEDQTLFSFMHPMMPWDRDDRRMQGLDTLDEPE
jgi:hypothetical protein